MARKMEDINEPFLKKLMKHDYQRFCSVTSMHGFTELYSAKTKLWKTIWVLIIVGSLIITAYQVNQAVHQFNYQISSTNIEPATEDEVLYPPLKLCLPHWLFWYDFDKAAQKFSRNASLYSLSYLTNIYINGTFNISEARIEFYENFTKYDFMNLLDYYASVAFDSDIHLTILNYEDTYFASDEYDITGFSKLFNKTHWVHNGYFLMFCYWADGSSVKEFAKRINSAFSIKRPNTLNLIFDCFIWCNREFDETELKYLTDQSFVNNMNGRLVQDLNHFPKYFYPNGFNDDVIDIAQDGQKIFTVKMSIAGNRWKSRKNRICTGGIEISSNTTCQQLCHIKSQFDISDYKLVTINCYSLVHAMMASTKKVNLSQICTHGFFINSTEPIYESKWGLENFDFGNLSKWASIDHPSATENLKTCRLNCPTQCEKWNFDQTIHVRSKIATDRIGSIHSTVVIEYPADGNVLIMTETDRQTWENFVSNVGGLLGIWTGASILSFIQMFYLCCCAEIDEFYFQKWFRLRQTNAVANTNAQITPPTVEEKL